MRDMTPKELNTLYVRNELPCCGTKEYLLGPRGGMMVNIECSACGSKFNVVSDGIKFLQVGQVLYEAPEYLHGRTRWTDKIQKWFSI